MNVLKKCGVMALALISLGFTTKAMAQCAGDIGFAHPNGGGFVAITANVSPSVVVSSDSTVCGYAKISGSVQITGNSSVGDFATIEGNVVLDHSDVEGFATIRGFLIPGLPSLNLVNGTLVFGHAVIEDDAQLDNSTIYGNARILSNSKVIQSKVYGHALIGGGYINSSVVHGLTTVGPDGSITSGALVCDEENVDFEIVGGWDHCALPISITKLTESSTAEHMCMIASTQYGSQVICWGNNQFGQLGIGALAGNQVSIKLKNAVPGIVNATDVSAGSSHTCIVRNSDTVECWGLNSSGQLGDASLNDSETPVVASGLTGITKVVSGENHNCALSSTGTVLCWGANSNGQIGDGTNTDKNVPTATGITTAIDIVVGGNHSCAILSDNSVQCWGSNSSGQLGSGIVGTDVNLPTALSVAIGTVQTISSGYDSTCAINDNEEVFCWGNNLRLQGGRAGASTEIPTLSLNSLPATSALASTRSGVCAVAFGQMGCWGQKETLGFETILDSIALQTPVLQNRAPIFLGTTANSVCAGANGFLMCWGTGALGRSGVETSALPISTDYIY